MRVKKTDIKNILESISKNYWKVKYTVYYFDLFELYQINLDLSNLTIYQAGIILTVFNEEMFKAGFILDYKYVFSMCSIMYEFKEVK